MEPTYPQRMQAAHQRLHRALAPQTDQQHAIVAWLRLWDLPTLETLALLVERAISTAARAARMELAQRTLDRWDVDWGAPPTEAQAMQYLASGGDPDQLPKPLQQWGVSRAHQAEHEDVATAVALAYDRGWAEGIGHARQQQQRGIDPELWAES